MLRNRQHIIWRLAATAGLLWTAWYFGFFALAMLAPFGMPELRFDLLPILAVFMTATLVSAAIRQMFRPHFGLVAIAVSVAVVCFVYIIFQTGVTLSDNEIYDADEYLKADPFMTPEKIKYSLFEVLLMFTAVISPSFISVWVNWPKKKAPPENEFT